MKKVLYFVGGAAVFYGAASLYRQYNLVKNTGFKLLSLKRERITIEGATLLLDGEVSNPTDVDFDIRSQLYFIYLNNRYVGTAGSSERVLIPAKGNGRITISIFLNFKQFLKAGESINWSEIGSNTMTIKGKLKTNTYGLLLSGIPINLQFKISDFLK